ncbi:MAG: VCBS repeat-containing protein [Anaerolineae bacterium]
MAVHDPARSMRGAVALDANAGSRFGILCANWEGPHRLFLQSLRGPFEWGTRSLREPSQARTVIAWTSTTMVVSRSSSTIWTSQIGCSDTVIAWIPLDIGDALEANGLGTSAAVADFDGDGRLELLILTAVRSSAFPVSNATPA